MALLKEAGSLEFGIPESKEFDATTPHEQLKFQKAAHKAGAPRWVLAQSVMPVNIATIRPPDTETEKLKMMRAEIDGDKIIGKLLPLLQKPMTKWSELAVALLLATGRRSVEIMKTGIVSLEKHMTEDGIEAVFTGQAKAGVDGVEDYRIPLLCPTG